MIAGHTNQLHSSSIRLHLELFTDFTLWRRHVLIGRGGTSATAERRVPELIM
jgi:hypothetical protein